MLAIAQNRHRVAERPDFAQAMRNEDRRHALGAQIGDDLAEPIDVAPRQCRGRLVEQQNARPTENGAGDFDLLLHGEFEFADFIVEMDVAHAECLEMRRDEGLRLAAADHARWAGGSARQQHIVEDGQIIDERHLLERGLDPARLRLARRGETHFLAEEVKHAQIGLGQS